MRSLATLILMIGFAAPAKAQQIADGTGGFLSEIERKHLFEAVGSTLKDPQSANLTKITRGNKIGICGYVNAKNAYGGYVGSRMFYAEPSAQDAFILPTGEEMKSYDLKGLDRVERMIPTMKANCLNSSGNPIM